MVGVLFPVVKSVPYGSAGPIVHPTCFADLTSSPGPAQFGSVRPSSARFTVSILRPGPARVPTLSCAGLLPGEMYRVDQINWIPASRFQD